MESQAEEKFQEFDQEVDAAVGRKKRKMSESQLKALAEGRKKRWLLKKSSGIKFEPIAEVESGSEESETKKKEVKVTLRVLKVKMNQAMKQQRVLVYLVIMTHLILTVEIIQLLIQILG